MDFPIDKVVSILKQEVKRQKLSIPIVTEVAITGKPFLVLISTVLSLRTKDAVTAQASKRLFAVANTPKTISKLSVSKVEKLIYPVGFYKTKAKNIIEICRRLVDENESIVPGTINELLKFKGVGRKTANLVLGLGYRIPAICVDTHVHRISNRLGYVKTKMPDETEMVLREMLPKKHWIKYNDLLVMWGQNICAPISPWCSTCRVSNFCKKIGVMKRR